MSKIDLIGIQKSWGAIQAVRDVNIEIKNQEFVVFLGPSGCGKTTTMRMIAGLEEPSDGQILMNDEVINEVDARDRDVAMVFQGYALYPNMTIYDNIRFPLRMRGVPKSEHEKRIRDAASLVELTDYLDRKPGALSGGQRQRAALARAIVRQPKVFLMDEPLSNLDAKLRQAMRIQIKQIQRELKITTVYVTHDQVEAMTLADRIVVMEKGEIQQIGTPDEIYNNPANAFVAGFIGSPPMNLIEGILENGTFSFGSSKINDLNIKFNGKVTLGFRPEDCIVSKENADINGSIYGIEPMGDMTVIALKTENTTIEIKASRDYQGKLNINEAVRLDRNRVFFFDTKDGSRLK